jgi:hypothetical protein
VSQTSETTCAFVTCVEAGPLEAMVLRLCASIRKFGGRMSERPIYAVTPRFSAPLARGTLDAFERLNVRHIAKTTPHRFGWYHFLNKPLSMLAAFEANEDSLLVWLDADTLVVREPAGLHLAHDEAVGACAPCHDIIGSTGPDDPRDAWWKELCAIARLPLESLPLIKTHGADRSIRLYLQAGVFGVRRDSRFAEAYLHMCERLLSSRVCLYNGPHWLEQIALGFAVLAGGFAWRQWPWRVNYAVGSFLPERFERPEFIEAEILHYHDALAPAYFPTFVERLRKLSGVQAEWLTEQGAVNDPQSLASKMAGLPVNMKRKVQRKLHVLRSRTLTTEAY